MATEIARGHGIHGNLHRMAEATRGSQSVIEELEMMETKDRRDFGEGKEVRGNGRKNIRGNGCKAKGSTKRFRNFVIEVGGGFSKINIFNDNLINIRARIFRKGDKGTVRKMTAPPNIIGGGFSMKID
jgi:hypothetical protein